jgi:hyperosmotically inducible periplasmic protein
MTVIEKLKALQIKATLAADKTVGAMAIDADVRGSLAVLTGEAETEEHKGIAEQLAFGIDGITEVRNEIRIVAPKPDPGPRDSRAAFGVLGGTRFLRRFADAEIELEVRRRFAAQREVDVSQVDVSSLKEIVHLSGVVSNREQLRRLQSIVLDVRDVTGICSEIVARG